MRLSRYNRLMAIKRHPEYIKEAEEYWRLLDQADTANDWGEGSFREQAAREGFSIERKWGAHPKEVKNAKQMKEARRKSVREVCSIGKPPLQIIRAREGDDVVSTSVTGKLLYLAVDISDTEQNLEAEFREIIRRYTALLPKDKSREKERDPDMWDAYDLSLTGIGPAEITRQLYNIPIDHNSFDSRRKQIERALDHANKIIQFITPA